MVISIEELPINLIHQCTNKAVSCCFLFSHL